MLRKFNIITSALLVLGFSAQLSAITAAELNQGRTNLQTALDAYEERHDAVSQAAAHNSVRALRTLAHRLSDEGITEAAVNENIGQLTMAQQVANATVIRRYEQMFRSNLQTRFNRLLDMSLRSQREANGVSASRLRRNLRFIVEGLQNGTGDARRVNIASRILDADSVRNAYELLSLTNVAHGVDAYIMESFPARGPLQDVTPAEIVVNFAVIEANQNLN